MKKPVIIGCGNMGSALIDALLQQGICQVSDLTIVEKYQNETVRRLRKQGALVLDDISELDGIPGLVFLAVKPQDSNSVLRAIAKKTSADTLLISVMAGISLGEMESIIPDAQIIRCIPNTPCSIKQGMTVYCGNTKVSSTSLKTAQTILSAMGKAVSVDEESMIDAATAISGSGPAYVFFIAEALKDGAQQLGFNDKQSKLLATQTLLGAAMLLNQSADSAEELRRKVTSPGGTTEAAFEYYGKQDVKELLINGFKKAFDRSLELGRK